MASITIKGENIKYDKRIVSDGVARYFHQGVEVALVHPTLTIVSTDQNGATQNETIPAPAKSKSQQKRLKVQTAT